MPLFENKKKKIALDCISHGIYTLTRTLYGYSRDNIFLKIPKKTKVRCKISKLENRNWTFDQIRNVSRTGLTDLIGAKENSHPE